MDAETKAALERFRSHEWWGKKLERDDEDTCLPREADAHRIVQLALSEHLPDDDEPVSGEWFIESGFEFMSHHTFTWEATFTFEDKRFLERLAIRPEETFLDMGHAYWCSVGHCRTRGQVRRLLKVLKGE